MAAQLNPLLGTRDASAILEPAYARKVGDPRGEGQRVAIIVNHGMGQQVPYETLEGVAKAVARGIARKSGATASRPLIRQVRLGTEGKDPAETELVRAEIEFQHGQQTYDVHIYESYWAPLTEGKVALKDVMAFLFNAGWNGFLNTEAKKGFQRWMFGSEQEFKIPKWRSMAILIPLMVLLLIISGLVVLAPTSYFFSALKGPFTVPLVSDVIIAVGAAYLIFLGTLVLPSLYKLAGKGVGTPKWLSWVGWILVVLGTVLLFLAGGSVPFQLGGFHPEIFLWSPVTAWATSLSGEHPVAIYFLWGAVLLAAYGARWFLVEYVGDVTAYIAAHTVSKFYELRQQIWQTAMKVSRAVYRAQADHKASSDAPGFLYEKIIMVGHSLGSVIGYDVLNGLLLEDAFSKDPLRIVSRTRMFLTFGSPLDKTAFLFRTQQDMRSPVREVAAAAVQPMIQGYEHRPEEWVNLYSKSDIISGALDFYDTPDKHDAKGEVQFRNPPTEPEMHKPVRNERDPDARTPLAAHVEYWDGQLFADELFRGITT